MSGLTFVIIPIARVVTAGVVMTGMSNIRLPMHPIIPIRVGSGNLGQMKVGKVVTVVMVMESRAAFRRVAGIKEDRRQATRSGEDRLPAPAQSARSVHHPIIRLWRDIGLP
jgi:hypothetical protein